MRGCPVRLCEALLRPLYRKGEDGSPKMTFDKHLNYVRADHDAAAATCREGARALATVEPA